MTIFDFIDERLNRQGNDNLFAYKDQNGNWVYVKTADFKLQAQTLASGLLQLGVTKSQSIAIVASTSYEWVLLDFACHAIGVLAVPIYESSSPLQIEYILRDADIQYVFSGTQEVLNRVNLALENIERNIQSFVIEDGALDKIIELGKSDTAKTTQEIVKLTSEIDPESIATIVYTSGSTGTPKGVELTHANFVDIVHAGLEGEPLLLMRNGARLLLFLPLAHVFARYLEFQAVAGKTCCALVPNILTLLADLSYFKPTYVLGVPRVFEKVLNATSQKAGEGLQGKIFADAYKIAVSHSKAEQAAKENGRQAGSYLKVSDKIKHSLYSKLVYSKIKEALGDAVEYCVCGGAALDPEIAHFFTGAGIPILEGYGLTECSAPAIVNRPETNRIGTVGLPLPGVEVRASKDGELQIKGKSVMRGYHNMEDVTRATIVDGWLNTGDLGEVLESGHVRVTGRKKDIIVTAGGKNVSPGPLEDIVRQNKFVSNVLVVGEGMPFISAIVTLDEDNLAYFASVNNLKIDSKDLVRKLKDHPTIRSQIDASILSANKTVSTAESIRKYIILDEDFTEANEQMTPSMKVRRDFVINLHMNEILSDIYNQKLENK